MSDATGGGSAQGGQGDFEVLVDTIDLTDEDLNEGAVSPTEKTISGKRESTRSIIAYTLLGVLIAVSVGWVLIGLFVPGAPADGPLDKIFTGVLGLTGTVVGFYFGSASQEQRN